MILGVLGRVNHVNVGANDPHADGTTNGTAEQELSAAELVDQEQQPDKGCDGLDDTKDTSHQVYGVGSDTDAAEDGRRVVVDGVDTRTVLPEEKHAADEETPLQLGAGAKGLEGLPEAEANGLLLHLIDVVDAGDLLLNVGVGGLQLADPAQVLDGLLALVVQEEPAGRLWQQERADQEQSRRDQLHSEGDDPLLAALGETFLNTKLGRNSCQFIFLRMR